MCSDTIKWVVIVPDLENEPSALQADINRLLTVLDSVNAAEQRCRGTIAEMRDERRMWRDASAAAHKTMDFMRTVAYSFASDIDKAVSDRINALLEQFAEQQRAAGERVDERATAKLRRYLISVVGIDAYNKIFEAEEDADPIEVLAHVVGSMTGFDNLTVEVITVKNEKE